MFDSYISDKYSQEEPMEQEDKMAICNICNSTEHTTGKCPHKRGENNG